MVYQWESDCSSYQSVWYQIVETTIRVPARIRKPAIQSRNRGEVGCAFCITSASSKVGFRPGKSINVLVTALLCSQVLASRLLGHLGRRWLRQHLHRELCEALLVQCHDYMR
jgi:hypothetical protein